jgi:hypothetical protein
VGLARTVTVGRPGTSISPMATYLPVPDGSRGHPAGPRETVIRGLTAGCRDLAEHRRHVPADSVPRGHEMPREPAGADEVTTSKPISAVI